MKNQTLTAKSCISNLFLGTLSLYGGSWLGFLVSMIPLYIVRGNYHDTATLVRVESLVSAIAAVPAVCAFLILFYRQNDASARASRSVVLLRSVGSAAVFALLSLGKTFVCAPTGYYIAATIDPSKWGPSRGAYFAAGLITGVLFGAAVYFGHLLAFRKHIRERESLTGHSRQP